MTSPDPPAAPGPEPDPVAAPLPEAAPRSPLLQWLTAHPVPSIAAGVALAIGVGVGGAALLTGGDDPAPGSALPSSSSTASPSASPSPSAPAPSSAPSPSAAPSPAVVPALDASCRQEAVTVAVCRFVSAALTGDLTGLTEGERALAQQDTDLPDAAFSVASCDLEGDVTVLCEVRFDDPERVAAGFRLQPSNGELDAATGQVVVDAGETLAYEVVELVGLRRGDGTGGGTDGGAAAPDDGGSGGGDGGAGDGTGGGAGDGAAPPTASPTPAPAAALVLGGDDLGVTRVGAPDDDAVAAVSRVLGPPVADPAPATSCVGAGEREVEWRGFRLAVTDGRVSGWLSSDRRLRTPSGLRLGSTVADLRRVLGDAVQVHEANPDSGPGFTVDGVALGGGLTGTGTDGAVTAFWSGACAPP